MPAAPTPQPSSTTRLPCTLWGLASSCAPSITELGHTLPQKGSARRGHAVRKAALHGGRRRRSTHRRRPHPQRARRGSSTHAPVLRGIPRCWMWRHAASTSKTPTSGSTASSPTRSSCSCSGRPGASSAPEPSGSTTDDNKLSLSTRLRMGRKGGSRSCLSRPPPRGRAARARFALAFWAMLHAARQTIPPHLEPGFKPHSAPRPAQRARARAPAARRARHAAARHAGAAGSWVQHRTRRRAPNIRRRDATSVSVREGLPTPCDASPRGEPTARRRS
jgi:hypothetical protein